MKSLLAILFLTCLVFESFPIRADEAILPIDGPQPQCLYSHPRVIYDVTANPLCAPEDCSQVEQEAVYEIDEPQPQYLYSNPRYLYECIPNPLSYIEENKSCEQVREVCDHSTPHCTTLPIPSRIEVYADALYWHPLFDGVEYATVIGSPSVAVEAMPHFTWGYKIGARLYTNCDTYYLESDYYNYSQKGSSSVSAPGAISPLFNIPLAPLADAASGEVRSKYEAVNILAGYKWFASNCFESSLYAGGRYVFIKELEFFAYDDGGVITPATQRYTLSGWGGQMGANFTLSPFGHCFCLKNVSFLGQMAMTGILADAKLTVNSAPSVFAPEGKLVFPPGEEFILGFDLKLEALYCFCIKTIDLCIRAGYELHSYQNARQRLTSSNQLGNEPKTISDLGYGGATFGLTISY